MLYLYSLSPYCFQVSFVVLVLKEGTSLGTLEIVTLAVGIPYTLFWCILGWCMVGTCIYIWASTRENWSSEVCKHHKRRPDCASTQSDQRLCCFAFWIAYVNLL